MTSALQAVKLAAIAAKKRNYDEVRRLLKGKPAQIQEFALRLRPGVGKAWQPCVPLAELLPIGLDVNHARPDGVTLLMRAAQCGDEHHIELIRQLLELGANISATDDDGNTVLHHAATGVVEGGGHCLSLLVQHGAHPQALNKGRQSPVDVLLVLLAAATSTADIEQALATFAAAGIVTTPSSQLATTTLLNDVAARVRREAEAKEALLAGDELAARLLTELLGDGRNKKRVAQAKTAKKQLDLLQELAEPEAIAAKDWARKIRSLFRPVSEHRHLYVFLCARVLAAPEAIAHAEWSRLVQEVAEHTDSWADLWKEMGQRGRVPADDLPEELEYEMGDGQRYTIDLVLGLLSTNDAVAHPDWEQVISRVFDIKRKRLADWSLADKELQALLSSPRVIAHPGYRRVQQEARSAFPYVSLTPAAKKKTAKKKTAKKKTKSKV